MNGQSAASKGNLDSRLGSRLRELADRVRALEHKKNAVGPWRLQDEGGCLVAVHTTGARRVLATLDPEEG